MEIDFKTVLATKRNLVWPIIENYLQKAPRLTADFVLPQKYQSEADFHWRLVEEYPRRLGKYLRPTLVLLTAQAMGVPTKKALLTAAAMQTSEDWILIHDDLEDDSQARRGKPALHQIFGKELAVNAGDGLHVLMWQMLWDNLPLLGEKKAWEIAEEFSRILTRTVLGQTTEIRWIKEGRVDLTDEDVFFVLDGKTSCYTIAGPMRLGAILGGADAKQLAALWEFGQYLGRCFQIIDDLLDLTSDFEGLKKQTGNDIYEGKRTLMLMHLFRVIKPEEKLKLREIMRKSREQKKVREVEWVIAKMKENGSLEYGRKIAENFAHQAKKIFETKLDFLAKQPARDELRAGIDFILNRHS